MPFKVRVIPDKREEPVIGDVQRGELGRFPLSRPESRPDPIGGSEPVFETRDSGLGLLTYLFFFFFKVIWHLWVWPTLIIIQNIIYECKELPPEWRPTNSIHIYLSPIYKYKTILSHLQVRARNLHVVNPYKCVGPAVCGCLLMSSPVPTRIKNPC